MNNLLFYLASNLDSVARPRAAVVADSNRENKTVAQPDPGASRRHVGRAKRRRKDHNSKRSTARTCSTSGLTTGRGFTGSGWNDWQPEGERAPVQGEEGTRGDFHGEPEMREAWRVVRRNRPEHVWVVRWTDCFGHTKTRKRRTTTTTTTTRSNGRRRKPTSDCCRGEKQPTSRG